MANHIFRNFLSDKQKVLDLANSMLEAHIGDSEKESDFTSELIEQKTNELHKLGKRYDNYIEMRADGEISKSTFVMKTKEIEEKMNALQIEIGELSQKLERTEPEVKDYSEKLTVLRYALEQYTNFDESENVPECVIEAFVVKIVASKDGFEWYLRFDGDPNDPLRCTLKGKRKATTEIAVNGINLPPFDSSPTGSYC